VPALYTRGDVATLLGSPLHELTWWIWALRPSRRYTRFEIARRGEGLPPRVIQAPIKPIKDVQRRLADILLRVYEPRAHVHGFVMGRSPLTNAQQHERQRWLMKIDLANFFPSINFGRVRGMFMAYPFDYPPEVATILAQICCHDDQLPQGAPTSPVVSNFICRGMDKELAQIARVSRCRFTRYADDLCFSTSRAEFPPLIATLGSGELRISDQVQTVISRHGFSINIEKTRFVRKSRRQRVTGLVVNRKANIPVDYVRSLRNILFIWKTYGESDAAAALTRHEALRNRPPAKGSVDFKELMRGRVQYVGSIKGWSNETYRTLGFALEALDPGFRPRTLFSLTETKRVRLYTEGPSDPKHLIAAHGFFVRKGSFTKLEFEIPDDSSAGGERRLLAKCDELALSFPSVPCVCIFDRDSQEVIRQAVGSTSFKRRGDNVAAVAISAPEWRDQRVCIEMLYRDEDLARRDPNGRRLYLAEEFDPHNGQHRTESVHVVHPDGGRTDRPLVREQVFRFSTGESVGLSKLDFAECVEGEGTGFEELDFDGFRGTFEVIEEAVVRMVSGPIRRS
jgi:RNA-directed DNA polymerase